MSIFKNAKNSKKSKIVLAIVKFAILILILVGVPLYFYFFQKDLIDQMSSLESVQELFNANKNYTVFIIIAAQCLQIVLCFIPGQWIQIASGYFFSVPISLVLALVGAFIGSVITYYLAKLLGHDAMHLFFGEERIRDMIHKLNSKKAVIIIFLIFLIPGIPKDLCNYAAGLSEMKLKPFLIVSLIGRTPAMLGSIVIGRQLYLGGYGIAIAVAVFAVIACILGIIYRHKLNLFLDRMYDKYIGEGEEENE